MTVEIVAFVTAMGHATNILKAAIDARDESKRREALAELNSAFADVQARHLAIIQNQLTLLEEKEALKKQIADYDKWEEESARYALGEIAPGFVAYVLKLDHAPGEPAHWLCATCYKDRQTSILHPDSNGSKTFVCPRNPHHLLDCEQR